MIGLLIQYIWYSELFVLALSNRAILSSEKVPAAGQLALEEELDHVLDDLCYYFRSPDPSGQTHDQLNKQLCRLKERQNIFKNHVSLIAVPHRSEG